MSNNSDSDVIVTSHGVSGVGWNIEALPLASLIISAVTTNKKSQYNN